MTATLDQNREHCPHQSNHTIDWEKVFSDPESGLITLLTSSTNKTTLLKVYKVILDFLFARDGDITFKDQYVEELETFTKNEENTFEQAVVLAKKKLNEIKTDRIEIAKSYVPDSENVGDAQKQPSTVPEQVSMREALINIIISDYRKTLSAIVINDYDGSLGKLPFIFSSEFHDNFFEIIKDFCLNEIAADCQVLVNKKPRHKKHLKEVIDNGTLVGLPFRTHVWDSWRQMWDINSKKQPLPKKPDAPSGVLAVGNLFTKKHEQETESWKRKTALVKAHNKKVVTFYRSICEENEIYTPPSKNEVVLMVKTFGKTAKGFEKQITALKQFLEQDTEFLARTFSRFIEGRNIDLSLLFVMYQNPTLISGENNYLKYLMRSYKKGDIKLLFPYTFKYLAKHMF